MAQSKLALTALPGVQEDFDKLPSMAVKKMALDMLVLIRDGEVSGEQLGQHVDTGDLSDCYKFYFDPDGRNKPRFRIVYRYTPNELQAVAVEAVAVGRRRENEVYLSAARRLRRT
ncbi:MAG: hypothetical protein ACTHXA_03220 [Gulosibacter sp.]|uniref:hypothetical protein n=1 Tax=Gulosibacter sp. TaxID=2817531 RepID=UPI003F8EB04D